MTRTTRAGVVSFTAEIISLHPSKTTPSSPPPPSSAQPDALIYSLWSDGATGRESADLGENEDQTGERKGGLPGGVQRGRGEHSPGKEPCQPVRDAHGRGGGRE